MDGDCTVLQWLARMLEILLEILSEIMLEIVLEIMLEFLVSVGRAEGCVDCLCSSGQWLYQQWRGVSKSILTVRKTKLF